MASQQQLRIAAHEDAILQGQAEIWKLIYGYAESMAVKCVVELRIPDIIHSHGSPMSLSQIASQIGSPSLDITYLSRFMRLLVHKKIFIATTCDQSGETLYGLTNSSRWLLQGSEMTLAPMLLLETDAWSVNPFYQLSATIKNGGAGFEKLHQGQSLWEVASTNPEFNKLFNTGMACTSKVVVQAILSEYNRGFEGIHTLVDVGGGSGYLVAEIVKANWPRIKGVNFDLQHVIQSAPVYPGVTHLGGNMFEFVPSADAIIMKWVLHDYNDEDCLKILRNCKKAMSTTGKIILVEMVLEPESQGLFDDTALTFDLVMMVNCPGGKERTQVEWNNLMRAAGFSQCTFIKIPALLSIIEAFAS